MTNQISENVRRGLETKRMLKQLYEAANIVTALQNAIECIEGLNEQIERDEETSDKLFNIYDILETIKQEKMCTVEFLENSLIERL